MQNDWSLAAIWNMAAVKENKPLIKRDYVYASELGGSIYDRYWKMMGRQPLTPPNDRSLRKFFAGNVWEYVVKTVLDTCGIYHQAEIVANAEPSGGLLGVHGRVDFIVEGTIDKERALANLNSGDFPEFLRFVAEKIINENAGKELAKKILEIKSCSMYVLDYVESRRAPLHGHAFQAYHYQRTTGIPAEIAYISKDTALIAQFKVSADVMEQAYQSDLAKISHYFLKGEVPPKEPILGFDYTVGKFSKNVNVEWSNYLTDYEYDSPDSYRRAVDPTIKRWNNALSRYAKCEMGELTPTGKPMVLTPKNKEVKGEILAAGYDFDELLQVKMNFANLEPAEDEE